MSRRRPAFEIPGEWERPPEVRPPRPARAPEVSVQGMVLRLADVRRDYKMGRTVEVHALRGIDLEIGAGEFVAIVGPSGSGKSTLLNLAGLLDRPTSGEVWLAGTATAKLPEAERARMRRDHIGFIFQTFNLLPQLTAEENVALPLRYADGRRPASGAADLLADVGLGERLTHRPDQLSGGEQQRVAIARALMLDPAVILADEPTGDLDSETAAGILRVLQGLRDAGKTLVVVTHNEELAAAASRRIHMRDGHIVDDTAQAPARARPRARRRAPEPADEETGLIPGNPKRARQAKAEPRAKARKKPAGN